MYCIYTGKEFSEDQMTEEHIIPLSLGGCNSFTIMVEKNINSKLGNDVDGRMAEDFLVKLTRARKNIKGHSRKNVQMNIKGDIDNHPVIFSVNHKGSEVYDLINKKTLKGELSINLGYHLELPLRIRFVCKVALATGYYLFGEKFAQYADCSALRQTMLSNSFEGFSKELRFYDTFTNVKEDDRAMVSLYENLFKCIDKSVVIFSYQAKRIITFVAISGKYIGSVCLKANTEALVPSSSGALGRVLICGKKGIKDFELREILAKFLEALTGEKIEIRTGEQCD